MNGICEAVVFSLTILLSSAAPVDKLPAKRQVDAPQDKALPVLLESLRADGGAISGLFENFEAFPSRLTARREMGRPPERCCAVNLRGPEVLEGGFGRVKPLGRVDAASGAVKGAALPRRQSTSSRTSMTETYRRTYQLAER